MKYQENIKHKNLNNNINKKIFILTMKKNIVIIGDIMLDISYNGNATRIAQEACIPIVNVSNNNIKYTLGGAANVCNNLHNIGLNTIMIYLGSNDQYSDIISKQIKSCTNKNFMITSNRCSTVKHRFYVNKKIIFRYDNEETHDINSEEEQEIAYKFNNFCNDCDILILSDYNKGILTQNLTKYLIKIANEKNIKVFVDPKIKNFEKYGGTFLIKPNQTEGEQICNHKITKDNLKQSMSEICFKTGSKHCLLTLGENGMALLENNDIYYIDTIHNNVIDITGAGDVVLSGFVYYYLKTNNLFKSTKFSNYCGQIKVRNFGTYKINKYDILMYETRKNKLIIQDDLKEYIQIIKKENKKIIFTNGCYDILHFGHLSFLEEAKKLGDILIVALNSDSSVKTIKGETRPVNNIEYRIKQISAINYVDFVVVFDETTPENIIKLIRPNILVKGGDYKIENIIGKEYAEKTIIIPYHEGFSTTNIITKLQIL
jgi:D-beta-D-heptose 7-phosphate kinase/D-beta-D-heptose 1-phosphate adenosyltransferase